MVMVAEKLDKVPTCYPMQSPIMSAQDNPLPRKLKFKITTKGIRPDSDDISSHNAVKVVIKNGQTEGVTECGSKCSDANVLVNSTMPANSYKRKPEIPLNSQRGKKVKMDQILKLQCANILKELMNHPDGWIFGEPVDPVKLQIPDYFSIITKPMDLGTIKHKLGGNMYFGAEEFAADVRLTFSNAMLYNPPENHVHVLAKTLHYNFSRRWKVLEAKLIHRDKNVKQASFVDNVEKKSQDCRRPVEKDHLDSKSNGHNRVPLRLKLCNYRPMSVEEKQSFRLELMQALSRSRMMGNLETVFHRFNLADLNQERLDVFIDSAGDDILWKLRREIKVFLDGRDGKAGPVRKAESVCPTLEKAVQKELHSQSACESAKAKCTSCASLTCHCQPLAQVSISDVSSERSSEHDHRCGDSKNHSELKSPPTCLTSSGGLDSDGPGVVLNEETSPRISTPASTAALVEGWNSFGVEMSPTKALRAAMLKSRFADTIFRATHQTTVGQKSGPQTLQQERARLEKKQLEEKARIEAEIKAAEAASRRRAQDDLKIRRERDRAAARMELQMMERTVAVNENMETWKEVETFCSPRDAGNALKQLGLYMKEDEYCSEDESDAIVNGEEGEIL